MRNIACLVLLAAFSAGPSAQMAQPVRLLVPFETGGGTDIVARILAPRLSDELKHPVIVENKPGASGMIGTLAAKRAAADGATLLMGTNTTMSASPAIHRDLPYDVLKDFVPVAMIATMENVLVVHPSLPVSSARDLIAYAKAHPGQIAYGSSGIGSTYHLGTELFAAENQISLTHVPYKGAGPAAQALAVGQVQMMIEALYSAAPNIRAGKVKALGIASPRRSPTLPDVPTLDEQGIRGCEFSQWIAFFLPMGATPELADRLNASVNAVLHLPEVEDRLHKLAFQPTPETPESVTARMQADLERWTKVVKTAHIEAD
jgi:tripartite-type tricarboxylate transporter receptor subunit TctC